MSDLVRNQNVGFLMTRLIYRRVNMMHSHQTEAQKAPDIPPRVSEEQHSLVYHASQHESGDLV